MGSLSPDAYFLPGLIAQEDTLLGLVGCDRVHARDARSVACSCINRKSAIDIPSCLVELDGLPGVLGRLTDTWTFSDARLVNSIARMWLILIGVLNVHITLDLILTEAQG